MMTGNDMFEVLQCPSCRRKEYYGGMTWIDGKEVCRQCAYDNWQKKSDFKWNPKIDDFVFPKYLDGEDYTKEKVE